MKSDVPSEPSTEASEAAAVLQAVVELGIREEAARVKGNTKAADEIVQELIDEDKIEEAAQRAALAALQEAHDQEVKATGSTKYNGLNPTPAVTNGHVRFGPGNKIGSLGAGKPKRQGRRRVIDMMDKAFNRPEVQKALAEAIINKITSGNAGALDALRNIIMPVIPASMLDPTAAEAAAKAAEANRGNGNDGGSGGATIILTEGSEATVRASGNKNNGSQH